MNAFANNNEPYVDHGIEVAYRFADFDPLTQPHTYVHAAAGRAED